MAFLTLVRRGIAVDGGSNATAWTPATITFTSLNTVIAAGEKVLWIALVSADGNPTVTETQGWAKINQASDATNAVTGAIFVRETTAAYAASAFPGITINSTAGEQYSLNMYAFKAAAGKAIGMITATSAQGSSTNSNPPLITNNSGASQDMSLIASRHGDAAVVATVAPTNYTPLLSQAGATQGSSTNSAARQLTMAASATEDPATFTSATEQWVSWTFGAYEFTPLGRAQAHMIG